MFRVAIDTGGTFTDYIAVADDGRCLMTKAATDRQDHAAGIIKGLHELADLCGTDLRGLLAETEQIVHGTTLALNALLEKRVARTALLTTAGFRDALEIGRSRRAEQWDLRAVTSPVLVPRHLRIGVRERIDYKGQVITPLDREQMYGIAGQFAELGIESVAICFLFSFLNCEHEEAAASILRELLPHVFVSTSSEVAPRIREYERTTTTVLNAGLTPVLADYLNRLTEQLRTFGWQSPLHIMMNSGGLSDAERVKNSAVRTLLSGPAGGARGGQLMAAAMNRSNLVLADMGGTSFDVNVIIEGGSQLTPETEVAGYPVAMPMIDIKSIGAGGGSIASIGADGLLMVGPDSAGAYPGPACYGRGGTNPTVTDAALILGLIEPEKFLDGRLKLDKELSKEVMQDKLCGPLGLTVTEASLAVYQIASAKMADAVRLVTVQQGLDPREFTLVAAGGAFPLFAGSVARALEIPEVVIPAQGPVFCAWGMLGASCQHEVVRSCLINQAEWDPADFYAIVSDLRSQGDFELDRLAIPEERREYELSLEMKYADQHHEISIDGSKYVFGGGSEVLITEAFHRRHGELYGYSETEKDWYIVNIRLICREQSKPAKMLSLAAVSSAETSQTRLITFDSSGPVDAAIYGTQNLQPTMTGPALIEFPFTSALVPPGFVATVNSLGYISIHREEM